MQQQEAHIEKTGFGTVSEHNIVIEDVRKSFDQKTVLDGINLNVKRGENVVLIGKSGIGKSVLIKCIVRLIEADSGQIYVFGKDIQKMQQNELLEARKKIGFLFQGGALYDSMTVRENLKFSLVRNMKDMDKNLMDQKIKEALSNVGLLDAINKMPSELSGGMKKRIALARTIIMEPDIILYDEPTTGLDPATSKEISNLIVSIQKMFGTSSIIVTHDISLARDAGDRITYIQDGKLQEIENIGQLGESKKEWMKFFTQ